MHGKKRLEISIVHDRPSPIAHRSSPIVLCASRQRAGMRRSCWRRGRSRRHTAASRPGESPAWMSGRVQSSTPDFRLLQFIIWVESQDQIVGHQRTGHVPSNRWHRTRTHYSPSSAPRAMRTSLGSCHTHLALSLKAGRTSRNREP